MRMQWMTQFKAPVTTLCLTLGMALAASGCSSDGPVVEQDEVPTQSGPTAAERQPTSMDRLGGVIDEEDIAAFREEARDDLNVVVRQIEFFEARADETEDRARSQYRDFADDLNTRAERLRLRLQNFEAETEADFRQEKARIEAELRSLEDDVDRLGRDVDDDGAR